MAALPRMIEWGAAALLAFILFGGFVHDPSWFAVAIIVLALGLVVRNLVAGRAARCRLAGLVRRPVS